MASSGPFGMGNFMGVTGGTQYGGLAWPAPPGPADQFFGRSVRHGSRSEGSNPRNRSRDKRASSAHPTVGPLSPSDKKDLATTFEDVDRQMRHQQLTLTMHAGELAALKAELATLSRTCARAMSH